MASMLVDSFADDFRPEDYTDDYRVELQQLIDAKLEGGEAFPTPEKEEEGEDAEVVDLLAALQRSVERHKGADSKSGDSEVRQHVGSTQFQVEQLEVRHQGRVAPGSRPPAARPADAPGSPRRTRQTG